MNERIATALQKASSLLSKDSCFLCSGRVAHDDNCIMNDVENFNELSRMSRINDAKNILLRYGLACVMDNDCIYDTKQTEAIPCTP